MGRLIDVDELHKMAKEPTIYDINVTDVLSLIDDCPTAYSVEAVVKELEERSNGFFVDDEELGEMFVKTMPLPLVIEIVRGGRNE